MAKPILLVEDNEDDVFLMKQALKKAAVVNSLLVAKDGEEAIELLKRAATHAGADMAPCLVLLDLKMPRVPGLQVLEWIRKEPRWRTLPVVVLTSSVAESDVEAAYALGANSYFGKPAASDERHELLKLLDHYWLKRCVLPRLPRP